MERAEWAYVVRLRLWVYFPTWVDICCGILEYPGTVEVCHVRGFDLERGDERDTVRAKRSVRGPDLIRHHL